VSSLVQSNPAVQALCDRIEVAEAELEAARQDAARLSDALQGKDDELLRLEVLASLGERTGDDVKRRAKEIAELKTQSDEAHREVKRKGMAIEYLTQRLADTEEAAINELREEHMDHIRKAVKSTAAKIRDAIAANEELYDACEAMRAAGLRMPHADIVWRDLLEDSARGANHAKWRASWNGDGAVAKLRPRAAVWFEQLAKLGYDV
jgi:DNA repair exonuclease SbcCD ATPase subunit